MASATMHFNSLQKSLANNIFQQAETLAGKYFRLSREEMKNYRYDVKTLAHLEKHEVKDGAFAHLCRYHCTKDEGANRPDDIYFYRICLQDNRILDAVERGQSFIKLNPLLLYIAAHELVHIIRFEAREIDFDAPREEKEREEDKVHTITKDMLQSCISPDIKLILDCFSNRYKIGDLFN
ncbi:MAG TPA: hypothetical protein VMT12_18005 [Syntrophales bacterium]|nr:hypothetical protein [Syntrophales bacterium]